MGNDYAVGNAREQGRRAGRLEQEIADAKMIEQVKAECDARVKAEIDARKTKIDEARALGAAEGARRTREAMAAIISRTALPAVQRAMLVGLMGALDAPLVPDIVTQQKARIDELEEQLAFTKRREETQVSMKQAAIAGRAQALADMGRSRFSAIDEGFQRGLDKASEFLAMQKLRPADTKGPTKLAKELASEVLKLSRTGDE